MSDNNGGAIAIKGFDFQAMTVVFFAVKNINDDNFNVYIESEEDFTLHKAEDKAYVQVKSMPLSVKKLTKISKKAQKSILEKNLEAGNEGEYLIYLKEMAKQDLNQMERVDDSFIKDDAYVFSDSQRLEIINQFKKDKVDKSIVERVQKSRVFVSKFLDNLNDARIYMIGLMNDNQIDITDNRANLALNELFILIHEKAEYIVKKGHERRDYEKKKLTSKDLGHIFTKTKSRDYFKDFLEDTNYSFLQKEKIKRAREVLFTEYYSARKNMDKVFSSYDLDDDCTSNELIEKMKSKLDNDESNYGDCGRFVKIALIIDYISERAANL